MPGDVLSLHKNLEVQNATHPVPSGEMRLWMRGVDEDPGGRNENKHGP